MPNHPSIGRTTLTDATRPKAADWERMRADYRNLRGINFVPVYPQLTGTPNYYDVASPTAMWHFYRRHPQNGARIDEQLSWVKRCGFNTVRVFLSSPAWFHYRRAGSPNAFLLAFADFVRRCHEQRIYVIPVLWDDVAVHANRLIEPDFTVDPVGALPLVAGAVNNISYWHRDPGDTVMRACQEPGDEFATTLAGLYISECVACVPAAYARAILMWDAMNEPLPLPPPFADRERWVSDTMRVVKEAPATNGVSRTTTWSFRVTGAVPASVQLAADPNCDVLSLHPYGHTRATLECFLYDAVHRTTGALFGKPIVCTEIGFPGSGMSYRDSVALCRWDPRPVPQRLNGVPRTADLGAGEMGVGFMPWAFMIGHDDLSIPFVSRMPFKHGAGLFYHDGTCREIDAVAAFVDLARIQGIADAELWRTPSNPDGGWTLAAKTTGPDYVDPRAEENVGPELDDHATLVQVLTAPVSHWLAPWTIAPTWTPPPPPPPAGLAWDWDRFVQVAKLFRAVLEFVDVAALATPHTTNGNPLTAAPRPPAHPRFSDPWPQNPGLTYQNAAETFRAESDPNDPAHAAMLLRLETAYRPPPGYPRTGWLQPAHADPLQPLFVAIVVQDFLQHFAAFLRPLIVPRGGPY